MSARNRIAGNIAIVAGILLLIGGSIGSLGFWEIAFDFAENIFPSQYKEILRLIFEILVLLALLGGITVMLGGYLIKKDRTIIGKFLISIGAGIGIISFLISLIISYFQGSSAELIHWASTSLSGIGIVLSIVARFVAE